MEISYGDGVNIYTHNVSMSWQFYFFLLPHPDNLPAEQH